MMGKGVWTYSVQLPISRHSPFTGVGRTWRSDQLCCSSVCKHCRRRDLCCHSQVLGSSMGIGTPPSLQESTS
jgi:hypothetical protein